MTRQHITRIALTPGEPAGIGPDLCIQLAQQPQQAELILIADPELLAQRAELLRLPLSIKTFDQHSIPVINEPGVVTVLPVKLASTCVAGSLDVANSRYVIETLKRAVDGCIDGQFDALVTGPVHKGIINQAGISFSGHTEFLAQRTQAPLPVMMLQTDNLRVALATTHMPLSEVPKSINKNLLLRLIRILDNALVHQFGIQQPHIYVCGLNPHAGEDGHLGTEEIDIIAPALDMLRKKSIRLTGPLSADTIFSQANRNDADAFLAMYHDQGLPVLKTLGFGKAINVTLGLPIIRTSVDHGTALELAGTGKADPASLMLAVQTAIDMVQHQLADTGNSSRFQSQTPC